MAPGRSPPPRTAALATSLFARLCDPAWLERAALRTVRGKRRRPDVAWFLFELPKNLAALRDALRDGTWRPGAFRLLALRDPKPRVIARASIHDRVVHTAVADLIGPRFLRSASECDFACRPGFGQHRAVARLLELMRRHRFVMHLDVRSYFPSIDLDILHALIAERIRDPAVLRVVRAILESGRGLYDAPAARAHAKMDPDWPPLGRGLPMGSVTSQLFAAHVYLLAFDHFVKRTLKVPGYVRYVDDLFLFGDRRADLRGWREAVGGWLLGERGLRLKVPDARVVSCAGHLDGLGMRIARDGVAPAAGWSGRLRRRVRRHVAAGMRDREGFERSMRSSLGHVFVL